MASHALNMEEIAAHYWAIKGFVRGLPASLVRVYQFRLGLARNELVIVRLLEDGWTPEALALDVAGAEAFGSERYTKICEVVRDVQAKFKIKQPEV